ncbi:MAG: 50S ribosomal protein L4 [Dehalococcoidia bacterium]|nr:50S ribosomal protein L4 [Dehalococcoidia bacterium]
MKLPVHNAEGRQVRTLEVDDSVFGIQPNQAVLHQAFVAQRANQRWGTAQTKTRGEVQGSTRKIRAQKYTGRSRQGSNRAPHRVGGGVAFGPRLRDYSQALPKKMRRLAIRSALSGKLADGQLVVLDQFALEAPKTREIVRVLRNVGIQRSALIVTGRPDRTVLASARNLEKTKVLPAAYLNVVDMLNHNCLLMTEEAVRVAEQLWGRRAAALVAEKAPARRARAAKPAAAAVEPAPAPAKAAAKTPARRARAAKPAAAVEAAPAPAKAAVKAPRTAPARAVEAGPASAKAAAKAPARHARAAKAPAAAAEAAPAPAKTAVKAPRSAPARAAKAPSAAKAPAAKAPPAGTKAPAAKAPAAAAKAPAAKAPPAAKKAPAARTAMAKQQPQRPARARAAAQPERAPKPGPRRRTPPSGGGKG